jgi:hypothetical protein
MSAVLEEPQTQVLESTAISIREKATAIKIVDQATYDLAAAEFNAACHLEKQITDHYAPLKQKAHEAHKAICSAEKEMLNPVLQAKQSLSRAIGSWDSEQERIRREQQRRLEAQASAQAEEEALEAAIDAEQNGADAEEIEAVLSNSLPITKVAAAPTYQKSVPTRENWSAQVFSLAQLVKAAAQNPAYLCYLQANETALNGAARSQKNLFSIPGCKAVKQTIATRGRK